MGVTLKKVGGVIAFSPLVLVGCAADEDDSKGHGGPGGYASVDSLGRQTITGSVKEWEVTTDAGRAKAGEVTFVVTNEGTISHEFLVVKTDVPLGEIPVEGDRFSEEDEALIMVDEIPEYEKGTTEELTVTLDPGTYQLVCNIARHYSAGMHTALVVEG